MWGFVIGLFSYNAQSGSVARCIRVENGLRIAVIMCPKLLDENFAWTM